MVFMGAAGLSFGCGRWYHDYRHHLPHISVDGIFVSIFGIEDFLLAAEQVLGIDAERLMFVTKIPLVESALAAPFAEFGGHVFYEDPVKRAAVLASRIMRNHPLPDGNKRVALVLMRLYLKEHGWRLTAEPEDIDRAFRAVAAGESEHFFHVWLISRTERQ